VGTARVRYEGLRKRTEVEVSCNDAFASESSSVDGATTKAVERMVTPKERLAVTELQKIKGNTLRQHGCLVWHSAAAIGIGIQQRGHHYRDRLLLQLHCNAVITAVGFPLLRP